jgi:dihydroxyacetone kinase-like protein
VNTASIIGGIAAVRHALLASEGDIESLDRAIGDGDHFVNVRRGCEVLVALSPLLEGLSCAQAFQQIGSKLLSTIGGASGPLFASLFMAMGKELDGTEAPDARHFARAFAAGVDAIRNRGKADVGEKTMLDVLIPVSRLLVRLSDSGADLDTLTAKVKAEALGGMLATKDMVATKGRAHFLGERAIGHIDPGAKTCQVAVWAVCDMVVATARET